LYISLPIHGIQYIKRCRMSREIVNAARREVEVLDHVVSAIRHR